MNWLAAGIALVLFLALSLLQASFFPYFAVLGAVPNLVVVLFLLIVFFEPARQYGHGFFAAVLAGVLLDMFLPPYFGVSIAALLMVYALNKIIMHFFTQHGHQHEVFYFTGMFSLLFAAYALAMYGLSFLFHFEPMGVGGAVLTLIYSLPFGIAGFYISKKIFPPDAASQLKLL